MALYAKMETFTGLMSSSVYEEFEAVTTKATTTAITTTGSQREGEEGGGAVPAIIACDYDNLLEENMILRNILDEVKGKLALAETDIEELQQKAAEREEPPQSLMVCLLAVSRLSLTG